MGKKSIIITIAICLISSLGLIYYLIKDKNTYNIIPEENVSLSVDDYKVTNLMNHYRTLLDKNNQEIMLVFSKNIIDITSGHSYYLQYSDGVNNINEKVYPYIDDEHMLVIRSSYKFDKDYSDIAFLIVANEGDQTPVKVSMNKKFKEFDLSLIDKSEFMEHEKFSHHISSIKGAIKIAEKNMQEKEELIKFSEEKIKEFSGESDKQQRFIRARDEEVESFEKQKSIKEEKELELKELLNQNKELEELFTEVFGDLHKH